MKNRLLSPRCMCGQAVPVPAEVVGRETIDSLCSCGRHLELRREKGKWTTEATLTPERRVPLSGFSADLKNRGDSQRYYFHHRSVGNKLLPVHIVFSPSARQAEVKSGDMKALRLAGIESVTEARRYWIDWFDARGINRPRVAVP